MENIKTMEGLVYKAVSGFYYVWVDGHSVATKPRGVFRHQSKKPLVGDYVRVEFDPSNLEAEGRLISVAERKNEFVRPPIANVDEALVVSSLREPDFSQFLLDSMLVSCEANRIEPIIVLTKKDKLIEDIGQEEANKFIEEIRKMYESIGYSCVAVALNDNKQDTVEEVSDLIEKGIHVIMGQSGVGKSTLLNHLLPELELETGEISQALGRGRHTTREVTLYPYKKAYLADTPGFSQMSFDHLEKEELEFCYPEITRASAYCKFRSCMHINEPSCMVKERVSEGEIYESRYQHYLQLYQTIENRKPVYR